MLFTYLVLLPIVTPSWYHTSPFLSIVRATKWFGFLQKRIVIPGRPNLEIVARVLTDQTVFASTNLFCFLSSMALMEGTDPQKKLQDSYFTALQKNWMVWPAVQFTNFKFVPLEHRVLLVNVVSLGKLPVQHGGTVLKLP